MREFTKSMMSYTWAMSLFGVQQALNIFSPSKATESFDNVTEATREEFGEGLRAAFRAGDNLQRGVVDLTFGVFGLGMFNGRGASYGASDVGQRSGDILRESVNAAGQAADAFGRVAQGAASYAADATRQGMGRMDMRGAGQTSGAGQQTADVFGQGMRAMGQAVEAVGQTMEGAAYATGAAMGGGRGQAAGPGAPGTSGAQAQGATAGQTQSWGAPSRGSGTSKKC